MPATRQLVTTTLDPVKKVVRSSSSVGGRRIRRFEFHTAKGLVFAVIAPMTNELKPGERLAARRAHKATAQ